MSTGYSDKSLKEKLGLRVGMSTYFMRAPSEYWQELGIRQNPYDDDSSEYDFIHAFFTSKEELSNFADILVSKLARGGMMWISWPRLRTSPKSPSSHKDLTQSASVSSGYVPTGTHPSENDHTLSLYTLQSEDNFGQDLNPVSARRDIPSDITEQDLRDILLPLGIVDVKVCAVTDQWSGLKFVWRKQS